MSVSRKKRGEIEESKWPESINRRPWGRLLASFFCFRSSLSRSDKRHGHSCAERTKKRSCLDFIFCRGHFPLFLKSSRCLTSFADVLYCQLREMRNAERNMGYCRVDNEAEGDLWGENENEACTSERTSRSAGGKSSPLCSNWANLGSENYDLGSTLNVWCIYEKPHIHHKSLRLPDTMVSYWLLGKS